MRLAQVLSNLLNNAAKFTDDGGEIHLSARPVPSSDEVEVRIRDNGIGIPRDLLPRIFEIFTQGAPPEHRGRGGLGVGLSLARNLVELHGGTIEAHSAGSGQGSELVLRLPLAAEAEPPTAPPSTPDARPMRILVVDDSPDQADSLGALLELMGHEVSVAYTGQRAVEAAAAFRPEVALVDIGLPDISGYELAGRLRGLPGLRNILLVAQTGHGQPRDQRRSRQAGFDRHLVKPLDTEELSKILSLWSSRSRPTPG